MYFLAFLVTIRLALCLVTNTIQIVQCSLHVVIKVLLVAIRLLIHVTKSSMYPVQYRSSAIK